MKIGIIGAGNIGSTLTRLLTRVGHEVSVGNSRSPDTIADLAADTGAAAVGADQAADGAEVVIVTVPERRVSDLPVGVLDRAIEGAVVVDTGNYYPQRDGRLADIEGGLPESRWVEEQLGHPVIKAFNTIPARELLERGQPAGSQGRRALPVAGDDGSAKALILALVDQLGFDAVDAGGLDESWRQQPGTPCYAQDLDVAGLRRALADARPERTPEWRA